MITDDEFSERFEAAREACLTGHEAGCTYGGMSPAGGYWLAVGECSLNHGAACAICGHDAEAGFGGWDGGVGGFIWSVPLCDPCRVRELALNPGKWREP